MMWAAERRVPPTGRSCAGRRPIRIGIREHPRAHEMALACGRGAGNAYPLNVAGVLDGIETHKIYDISSERYNARVAAGAREMLLPRRAWTVYDERLDVHLIVWNAANSVASIRYSVAHELGHIVLNHERGRPAGPPLQKRRKEAEANVFACSLLAPFEEIYRQLGDLPFNCRFVADFFGIPYAAARGMKYDYEYWLLCCRRTAAAPLKQGT